MHDPASSFEKSSCFDNTRNETTKELDEQKDVNKEVTIVSVDEKMNRYGIHHYLSKKIYPFLDLNSRLLKNLFFKFQ